MNPPGQRRAPVRIRVEDERGFERVVLFDKKLLRIGSGAQTDLQLNHPSIAPCHVVILREGEGFSFADTTESHGTFINGKRASKGLLDHNDVLTFGGGCPYRVTFLTEGARADDRLLEKLRTLLQASKAINSSLILGEVLDRVMDAALIVTGAEKGFLMLRDSNGKLRPRAARNIDEDLLDQETLPASRSIIDKAISTKRTIRFLAGGEGLQSQSASILRLKLSTVFCAPILSREEVIGIIYLDHRGVVKDLSGSEEEILEALAGQASVAIENARLSEQTLKTERLTAVGRMVSSIVHDLRGPLTGVQTAAQFLLSQEGGKKSHRMLGLILDEVERMSGMTQELLEFCRGNVRLDAERKDLAGFIEKFVADVRSGFESETIKLHIEAEPGITVDLDVPKMERVLRNLLCNALEAMPDGGTITLRTRAMGESAELLIKDTGCGMSDSLCGKVLEPFFTSGKENGTGLGLAIAHRVVEAHGGELEVESAPQRGTTIRILIPLRHVGSAAPEPETEPAGVLSS